MKTTITHPDGSQTVKVTEKPLGCCGWFLWICLGALILGGPATYFPRWAEVLAYAIEGTVAILLILGWSNGKFSKT